MAEPKMLIPLPDDMARLMKLSQWQAAEIARLREQWKRWRAGLPAEAGQ